MVPQNTVYEIQIYQNNGLLKNNKFVEQAIRERQICLMPPRYGDCFETKEVRLEIYSGSLPVCPSAHDLAPEQLNKNQSAVV